jgi:hypothetical protein
MLRISNHMVCLLHLKENTYHSAQSKPGETLGRRATGLHGRKETTFQPMSAEPPGDNSSDGFFIA